MVTCAVAAEVGRLYETTGWITLNGITHDAARCEDLRSEAAEYVSACRMRVKRHLPATGDRLIDMASGPIQYPEYLTYSEGFRVRSCFDLSARALEMARAKLGGRGEYTVGDFLDVPVSRADAAISIHTLYHIAAARQEETVRKLLAALRPGAPAVIVYSNPDYPVSRLLGPIRRLFARPAALYFHRHPLSWWTRFEDVARVEIHPWRTLPAREQRLLGRRALAWLYRAEERWPRFFARWGCYPMIVLTKHQGSPRLSR